jgi:hypothetical protein
MRFIFFLVLMMIQGQAFNTEVKAANLPCDTYAEKPLILGAQRIGTVVSFCGKKFEGHPTFLEPCSPSSNSGLEVTPGLLISISYMV